MLEVEYAISLATLFCEENLPDKVLELRFSGIRRLKGIAEYYAKEGLATKVIEEIWRHKLPFVLSATSKAVMEEILKPSTPGYNGNRFQPRTPYHSEAEELLLWSKTSLYAPLISAGFDRYMELFEKFYPDEAKEIRRGA